MNPEKQLDYELSRQEKMKRMNSSGELSGKAGISDIDI